MNHSNGWPVRCLGEIAENQDAKRIPLKQSDREQRHGQYPYYGASGVIDHVDEYLFDGDFLLIGKDGANLLARSRPLAFLASGRFWVNNHAHILSFNGQADLRYLARFLEATDLKKYVTGTAQPKLTRSNLDRIPVPLPHLSEQRRIAAILDKADAISCKREEGIRLTEELLRSTFLEIFGDPTTNSRKWPTALLGSVAKLDRGRSRHRPRDEPSLYGGEYPFIQTGDVSNSDGYISDFSQTYSEAGLAQSKLWPEGTLCITIAANIAKTAILAIQACFPDSLVGLVAGERLTIEYVRFWFVAMEKVIDAAATQVAQKNINLEILNRLTIPVPPLSLQQRFSKIVKQVYAVKQRRTDTAKEASVLFDSLVQRGFRGEL